jgi:phenylpropionate dioxygenase-like ring-hydroxylating dioxygenase large terminal subunit
LIAISTVDLLRNQAPKAAPGAFYDRLLEADSRPVPDIIRSSNPFAGGPVDVPIGKYTLREYHDLEVEKLWSRVWQMACRADEIPAVGDTYVYDVANLSFVVVRISDTIVKAFVNSCLHRGRKFMTSTPCPARVHDLRCPFHGFTWDLEGYIASVPASWDFAGVDFDTWRLPEAQVAEWGGFIFINPDPNCLPFAKFIGDLDQHFAPYGYTERYTAAHVVKALPCNWKAAQEAFMESFHLLATHPQLLAQASGLDAKYDAWGTYSRACSPNFLPSSFINWVPSEQEMMDVSLDRRLDGESPVLVPDGATARQVAADQAREGLAPIIGEDTASCLSDAEVVDSFYFTLFPNLHPWSSYNRICFRFRPDGDSPDTCLQDVYLLNPYRGDRPQAAPTEILQQDEDWTASKQIGQYLARILNQDLANMAELRQGMRTSRKGSVTFSRYQESKIRHFHSLLDAMISDQPGTAVSMT